MAKRKTARRGSLSNLSRIYRCQPQESTHDSCYSELHRFIWARIACKDLNSVKTRARGNSDGLSLVFVIHDRQSHAFSTFVRRGVRNVGVARVFVWAGIAYEILSSAERRVIDKCGSHWRIRGGRGRFVVRGVRVDLVFSFRGAARSDIPRARLYQVGVSCPGTYLLRWGDGNRAHLVDPSRQFRFPREVPQGTPAEESPTAPMRVVSEINSGNRGHPD